jgi:hypothetical protein
MGNRVSFQRVKPPRREVNSSPPSSALVKNKRSRTSTTYIQVCLHGIDREKLYFDDDITTITMLIKNSNNNKCHQFEETVDCTVSACPVLAKEQYTNRHNRVCAQLNFNICKELGVKLDSELWYEQYRNQQKQVKRAR